MKCSHCDIAPDVFYITSSQKLCVGCFAEYALSLLRRVAEGEDLVGQIRAEFRS